MELRTWDSVSVLLLVISSRKVVFTSIELKSPSVIRGIIMGTRNLVKFSIKNLRFNVFTFVFQPEAGRFAQCLTIPVIPWCNAIILFKHSREILAVAVTDQ